jgi:ppGpp synthetase/RelA/SpoT-type nucleotidyltranferase
MRNKMVTVIELNKKCKELGLSGYTKLKKKDLIKLIEKHEKLPQIQHELNIRDTNITNKQFLLGDFDGDKIRNIDDRLPLKRSKKAVEETKLSDAIIELDKMYEENKAVKGKIVRDVRRIIKQNHPHIEASKLLKITPSRAKTPISLITKALKYQIPVTTDTIGMRYIGKSENEMIPIKNSLIKDKNYEVIDIRDYYAKPKGGYKAIHLILKDRNSKKTFEIQLRTRRIDRVSDINHKRYKKSKQNTSNFSRMINICEKADNGDAKSKKFIDNLSDEQIKKILGKKK